MGESFTITTNSQKAINLAMEAHKNGDTSRAIDYLSRALMNEPNCAPAMLQMAIIYEQMGETRVANDFFDRAVEMAPTHPLVRRFHALNLMLSGDYDRGWPELKWRKEAEVNKTYYNTLKDIPVWNGEALDNGVAGAIDRYKRIVVWTEQGVGDELICGTMLPDLLKLTPEVTLIASDKMVPIFEKSFPGIVTYKRSDVTSGERYPLGCNYQASFSELGQFLRPTRSAFPKTVNFLKVDKDVAKGLRKEYRKSSGDKPLIGISWRSPKSQFPDLKDSQLSHWAHLLMEKKYQFVSLQYGDHHDEVAKAEAKYGIEIIEEGGFDPFVDVQTFANQIAALDLVISVSNSTVHFAGAMDKPVWTFVPERAGLWYWGQFDRFTPWYPSMRLFRGQTAWAMGDAAQYLSNMRHHAFTDPTDII